MDILVNNISFHSVNNGIQGTIHFNSNLIVPDSIRGYLININNIWSFHFNINNISNSYIKNIKKIALILESPHKNEYTNGYIPIGIAQGKTGNNINIKLINRSRLISNLNANTIYEVNLMNPIQYQCSCYNEFNGLVPIPNNNLINHKCSRSNTDKVFRSLFSIKKTLYIDFINRLINYNPDIIFNCCTYNLKGLVYNRIKRFINPNYCPCYHDSHPSTW